MVFPKQAASAFRAILAQEGYYFPITHTGKVYDLRLAAGAVPAHVGGGHGIPAFDAGGRLVDGGRAHSVKVSGGAQHFFLFTKTVI